MTAKVSASRTVPPPANPTTSYTATDQLGSPRVITNSQGEVTSRRDFMPFGEEITPDQNYRTNNLKYNLGDSIRQKFTGYQKDEETNLDFAEARMYENRFGRFTAVDPLLASGKSANPQTFNRYAYTSNNPITRIDKNGKDWETESCGKKCERPRWVQTAKSDSRWNNPMYVDSKSGQFVVLHPTFERYATFKTKTEADALYEEWYGKSKDLAPVNTGGMNERRLHLEKGLAKIMKPICGYYKKW